LEHSKRANVDGIVRRGGAEVPEVMNPRTSFVTSFGERQKRAWENHTRRADGRDV